MKTQLERAEWILTRIDIASVGDVFRDRLILRALLDEVDTKSDGTLGDRTISLRLLDEFHDLCNAIDRVSGCLDRAKIEVRRAIAQANNKETPQCPK